MEISRFFEQTHCFRNFSLAHFVIDGCLFSKPYSSSKWSYKIDFL